MAKKTKTKAWVKGFIAVAVIAVVGVLGYYGANGELFQGRLKLERPVAKTVSTVDRVNTVDKVKMDVVNKVIQPIELEKVAVDGVNETLVKQIAQPIELEKLAVEENSINTIAPIAGIKTEMNFAALDPKLELNYLDKVDNYSTSLYHSGRIFADDMVVLAFEVTNKGGGKVVLDKLGTAPKTNYTSRGTLTGTFDKLNVALGVGGELARVRYDSSGRYAGKDLVAVDSNKDGIFSSSEFIGMDIELGAGEKVTLAIFNDLSQYSTINATDKTGGVLLDLSDTQFKSDTNAVFVPEMVVTSFYPTTITFN